MGVADRWRPYAELGDPQVVDVLEVRHRRCGVAWRARRPESRGQEGTINEQSADAVGWRVSRRRRSKLRCGRVMAGGRGARTIKGRMVQRALAAGWPMSWVGPGAGLYDAGASTRRRPGPSGGPYWKRAHRHVGLKRSRRRRLRTGRRCRRCRR